jgi:hypothetical protein
VNCVVSKQTTGKGECIPTILTLIGFLSSFVSFKKTGICESFIFAMSLVFIYIITYFRYMKGIRTKGGFTHCLHQFCLSCVFFDEYEGYWIECRLSLIPDIHRVSEE